MALSLCLVLCIAVLPALHTLPSHHACLSSLYMLDRTVQGSNLSFTTILCLSHVCAMPCAYIYKTLTFIVFLFVIHTFFHFLLSFLPPFLCAFPCPDTFMFFPFTLAFSSHLHPCIFAHFVDRARITLARAHARMPPGKIFAYRACSSSAFGMALFLDRTGQTVLLGDMVAGAGHVCFCRSCCTVTHSLSTLWCGQDRQNSPALSQQRPSPASIMHFLSACACLPLHIPAPFPCLLHAFMAVRQAFF